MGNTQHICVLGAGISGLACGITLLEAGHHVTMLSAEPTSHSTSAIAAAIWHPFYQAFDERYRHQAACTLATLKAQARDKRSGVSIRRLTEYFRDSERAPWWMDLLKHVRVIPSAALPEGYKGAFSVDVPVADTSVYLPFLMEAFADKGGRIERRYVTSLDSVSSEFDKVINCTGFGSSTLANDPALTLIRGVILRVAKVSGLQGCWIDDSLPLQPTYVIERERDLILGGFAEMSLTSTLIDPSQVEDILYRCRRLVPDLTKIEIIETRSGFRPARQRVRLGFDDQLGNVIHNYGHGGSGFTLSWGCAQEVASACANS